MPDPADLILIALPFALWHRTGRRGKWREIGRAATSAGALALIDTSGKHGGDWTVKAVGVDPNAKEQAATT